MNKMNIVSELHGGLGNQLFIIFATICASMDNQIPFRFLSDFNDNKMEQVLSYPSANVDERHTYWTSLCKRLVPFILPKSAYNRDTYVTVHEKQFIQLPTILKIINKNIKKSIFLSGYYQNYNYFHHRKHQIVKYLNINLELNTNKTQVAIHFRYGDYRNHPSIYPLLPKEYYLKALEFISSVITDFNIIFFCSATDKDDNDVKKIIEAVREQYWWSTNGKVFDENCEDWEELIEMAKCDHHIIANSTYSWWAAYIHDIYLMEKLHIVCYPSPWYVNDCVNSTGLQVTEWIKIEY